MPVAQHLRFCAVLMAAALLWPVGVRANGWEHAAIPFEALLWGLGHEAAETRVRSAESLGYRGQAEALPFLLDALKVPEPDHRVRRALYTALGRLGDPAALPNLHGCLDKEAREELRGACVQAIAAIGDPGSLPRLLKAYGEDGHPLVRARLVEAFGRYPQEPSVELLIGLTAGDTDAALRLRAIRSLGETGSEAAVEPLLAALAVVGGDEQGVVVETLGRLGQRAASEPLAELLEKTEDPVLRGRIVIALAAIRDGNAYPVLVASLSDEVRTVRFYAVRALRDLGKAAAAPHLLVLYQDLAPATEDLTNKDKTPVVLTALNLQAEALRALVDLDPVAGLPAFLDGARGHDLPRDSQAALRVAEGLYERRRIALYGLGYTGSDQAAVVLTGAAGVGDADPRLRATAVRSLGVLGQDDAARRVLPLLQDAAPEVRWTAAMVLEELYATPTT